MKPFMFFYFDWFYLQNVAEMLENVTDPGYLSQTTPFTFQTFQCPKRLKIALVLLQSKKNFLTLYADRSLPDFLFLGKVYESEKYRL